MNPDCVYLAQTDTTAGILSADFKKLNTLKERAVDKPVLMEVDSLATLKNSIRVPARFKNQIRRSSKTTFIYPNKKAFRIVKDGLHLGLLKKFGQMYSTSANKTNLPFDYQKAVGMCDVIVLDSRGIFLGEASKILHINHSQMKKIR